MTEDFNYGVGGNPDDPAGNSGAVTLSGTWRTKYSARYTAARMSYNNTAGASLTVALTGNRIEIISEKDPYRGIADVLVDGQYVGAFDAYASVSRPQSVVFVCDVTPGDHTITVRTTGTRNPSARASYVIVDAFRSYSELPTSIAPWCATCHVDRVAGHW